MDVRLENGCRLAGESVRGALVRASAKRRVICRYRLHSASARGTAGRGKATVGEEKRFLETGHLEPVSELVWTSPSVGLLLLYFTRAMRKTVESVVLKGFGEYE